MVACHTLYLAGNALVFQHLGSLDDSHKTLQAADVLKVNHLLALDFSSFQTIEEDPVAPEVSDKQTRSLLDVKCLHFSVL